MTRKRLLVAALLLYGPASGLRAQISPTPRDLFGPEFDFTSRDKWLELFARSPKIDVFESLEPDCGRMSPGRDAVRLRVSAQPGGDPIREVQVHVVLAVPGTIEEFPVRIFHFSDATGVPELERRVAFWDEVRFLDRVRGYTIVVNRLANRRINQRYKPFLQIRLGDSEWTRVEAVSGTRWRFENFATVSADTFSVTADLAFNDGVTWRDILVLEEGTRSALVFRPGWGGWFWMSDVYFETRQRSETSSASREGWVFFRSNPARASPCGGSPATAGSRFRAPAAGAPGTSPPATLPDLELVLADASLGSVKFRVTNLGRARSGRTEIWLNAGAVSRTAAVPELSATRSHTTDWLDVEGPAGGVPDEFDVRVNVPRRFDESNYSNNSLLCRRRSVSEPGLVWDCEG